jgi:hypothetical protein
MQKEQSYVSAHPEDCNKAANNVAAAVEQGRAKGFEMGRRHTANQTEWEDGQGNPADRTVALDTLSA